MSKQLSQMTNEELWALFPVILCEHNPLWKIWFAAERAHLQNALSGEKLIAIEHIGSTAIPNILAKPTVDMLMLLDASADIKSICEKIEKLSYIKMPEKTESAMHVVFVKGYTPAGFAKKVFHLHLRYNNFRDELIFRDYLCAHADIANEYETLKISLKKKFEHNRDSYTNGKATFINFVLRKSKELCAISET